MPLLPEAPTLRPRNRSLHTVYGASSGSYGGSGGGISSYASQPSWQRGIVAQTSTRRAVPDVAMDADPNSGVAVYDSYDFGA